MSADLNSVDQNLQAIQAVERSWALPSLPDEVKLDLAGNGMMTAPAIQTLMTGLAADLKQAGRQQPLPTRDDMGIEEPVSPSYGYKPETNIGRTVAGVAGLPVPQVYDVQAPQRLKQRLVDGGYLNLGPEEVQSERWLPEYSYAARQLNFDDMTAQFQGDKPGSMSVDSILGVVDEWLTPRGLYRAAVELDLWWDQAQIKKEFQEWDQRLQSWRDDPLDPRKLVDLVTGPLDDLLFPALNIALMFTGIGEVMGVTRGLALGIKNAEALAGLYRGAKGLNFAAAAADDVSRMALRGASDIARFSRPSYLSGKVAGSSLEGFPQAAQAMEAWRRNGAVILGKKLNQQVMRMGFVSNVEQLVDSDRGGMSLNRFSPIGEQINTTFQNPMVDWGVDLLLTPPNIFNPGTYARPARFALEKIQSGFVKAAENQELTIAFDAPIEKYLRESVDDAAADAYLALRKKSGVQTAIRQTFFHDDAEAMGLGLSYVAVMAGVDHMARTTADVMIGDPLHELASGTRTLFHQSRNQIGARLKHLDEDNIEDLLVHFAKYGTVDAATVPGRSAPKFNAQYQRVRGGYLEAAGATKARAGSIPADHTRFIGHFNPDTGKYSWSPLKGGDMIEGDPYFLDISNPELRASLGDDADLVLSGEIDLGDNFINRYMKRDNTGRIRHWALSEADQMRLYDPEKLADLKDLARRHNELRSEYLADIMNQLTPAALAQYVYEVLPTFGRWDSFIEASSEIRHFNEIGELGNAKFVSPMSDSNRRLGVMPWTDNGEKWTHEIAKIITELPDDKRLGQQLMESIFSPFARDVDPQMGSFTAAGLETVTKQEALAFAATARRTLKMVKAMKKFKMTERGQRMLRETLRHVEETGSTKKSGLAEVLAEAFGPGLSEQTVSDLSRIAKIADEAGVGIDEIEDVIMRQLDEINALPQWSERYNVPTQMPTSGNVVENVKAKLSELQKQSYFMASEVEGVPDELIEFLAARQYKLVYGVEFAQPFDLDGLPHFADATNRQIRQKRMGDFFSRQDPEDITRLKVRKLRDGLHARLRETTSEGGRALQLGDKVDPNNADLNAVVEDLFDMLRSVQDEARLQLDSLSDRGVIGRVAGRASLHQIPYSLDRLASDLPKEVFMRKIVDYGYSRTQGAQIYQALQGTQALGFRAHGLYAIESKLRSSPNLINATRVGSVIMGGVAGGFGANVMINENEDPLSMENIGKRVAGIAVGGAAGALAGASGARALRTSMDAGGSALKYAYLVDNLANLRDKVRFSLSPVFDASRYSEAIILGQIGEMPKGVRNLRVNQSPTSFRNMLSREYRSAGLDADAARRRASADWAGYRDEFAAAARGYRDFEWEVIDGVGRRFSSIGILGFSPTDWMSSTYAHMRRAGADTGDAYNAVRDIYTYGTTGRSAAELSMNFVFFPFSFTKKTVTHLSKFFSDDLSRLVVLHDMFKTYEMLDDHFDLSQEWKDRLPILQKAHRLNLLAYGVGLGRFGGVNAPVLEGFLGLPPVEAALDFIPGTESIVNAFIPQMVPMNNAEDGESAWSTARQLLPVINDVNTMISGLVEQGYVIASREHMSRQAEQRKAWDEWRTFQDQMKSVLEPAGMSWSQATRNPELNTLIKTERARISGKYPSWKQGIGDGIAHSTAIDMEMNERILAPKTPADALLARFDMLLKTVEDAVGMTVEGSPESIPPEVFAVFRKGAIEYAQKEPEFLRLYNRFYRRSLGDITTELR